MSDRTISSVTQGYLQTHCSESLTRAVVVATYSAFTKRRTLADLVFLRDRKLVPLCRLLPHLLLWVLL